jgi:hypothetical protein
MSDTDTNFDFNTAGKQQSFDVIPANTICNLQMNIRPGNAGAGGFLTRATDGASQGLDVEFVVIDGDHARRKLWQRFTLSGTTAGHAEAAEISRNTLRAILESARGIKAADTGEEALAARKVTGWGDFDGLRFVARIGVRPPKDGYQAKNVIAEVITPDRKNYKQPEQVTKPSNGGAVAPATTTATPPANAVVRPQWANS